MWFLDKGGALVAVKQPSVPTKHLWYVHLENCLTAILVTTHFGSCKKMPVSLI